MSCAGLSLAASAVSSSSTLGGVGGGLSRASSCATPAVSVVKAEETQEASQGTGRGQKYFADSLCRAEVQQVSEKSAARGRLVVKTLQHRVVASRQAGQTGRGCCRHGCRSPEQITGHAPLATPMSTTTEATSSAPSTQYTNKRTWKRGRSTRNHEEGHGSIPLATTTSLSTGTLIEDLAAKKGSLVARSETQGRRCQICSSRVTEPSLCAGAAA